MKIVAWIVIVLCALAMAACSHKNHKPSLSFAISPQGYRVAYLDQGTILSGKASYEQICQWHAAAVDRGVKELVAKSGRPELEIRQKAASLAYYLVDNCAYLSPQGWATGYAHLGLNRVDVCLYNRVEGSVVPPDAFPWTVRQDPKNPLNYRWGVHRPGSEFPAIGHEIGHHVFGPMWEH